MPRRTNPGALAAAWSVALALLALGGLATAQDAAPGAESTATASAGAAPTGASGAAAAATMGVAPGTAVGGPIGVSTQTSGEPAAVASLPAATPDAATANRPAYPRKPLLPHPELAWSKLSELQRHVLAPFEASWKQVPIEEKRAWLALADRVPRMNAEQQQIARSRIQDWAALTPEQRLTARQNFRLARALPRDERVAQWQQYQAMTDEQRAVLQQNGSTSNTAARHAGSRTGLAKEAAQPISQPAVPPSRPATPSGVARP